MHPTTQIEESVPLNDSNKPTSTDNQSALLGINSPELSSDKDTTSSLNNNNLDENVLSTLKEDIENLRAKAETLEYELDYLADNINNQLGYNFRDGIDLYKKTFIKLGSNQLKTLKWFRDNVSDNKDYPNLIFDFAKTLQQIYILESQLKRKSSISDEQFDEQTFSAPASDSAIGVVPQGEGVNELSTSTEEQDIIDRAKANGTYLLAPNGRPTNLTPRQWAQVRTEAFKRWFGDRELLGKKKFLTTHAPVSTLTGNEFARQQGITLTDQVEQYFASIGGKVTSPIYGDVILDRRGADDSLAHGMSRNKAIAYAAVKDVIKTGILIDYDTNHKGRGYDSAVIAAPIEIAGERYICQVVIKRNNTENRFYLHEVTLQKNLLNDAFVTNLAQKPASKGDLAKLLQNILTASDNASKIIDSNGEPRVMYHGSNYRPLLADGTFNAFDGAFGKVIYFTSAFPEAADYAREKLDDYDLEEDEIYEDGYVTEAFLNIRDNDYIAGSDYGYGEIITWAENSNQIKSATDNIGTFDANNPDIRFRSIRPDESLSDYARAVVANNQQSPAGLNASVGSRFQEDLELIDAATERFKEYFNTPEIIQAFSRAELRKLYSDMTDAEFNERFKEYKNIGAIYDADRDKIYTFVENSENTYVELIHEATHAAIQKFYNSENLKDKLSHFVNEIEKAYTNFCKGLATTYSRDDYINELTAYTIDNFLNGSSLDNLLNLLSPQAQQELLPILKAIGYEKGRKQQSKQYARVFETSKKIRQRNGTINDSQTRKESLHSPTDVRDDAREPREREGSRIFTTRPKPRRYSEAGSIYVSQTRKESLHSPTDVRDDARKPQEREVGVGRDAIILRPQDNRTADTALDTIEQATADYAESLNAERGAIIDAITPAPGDSLRTIAEKTRLRSIGRMVTRDNASLCVTPLKKNATTN